MSDKTLIIAEAGVNHNGSEELAFKLVDAAVAAGVDVVKFQTFKAASLVTKHASQAEYQKQNSQKQESQLAMLSRLELSFETHLKLIAYCAERQIEFLSTAFDDESLKFLVNDLKLSRLKIPSGELTNSPFVLKHALTGSDLIVSTGMATLEEIEQALGVIAFGYLQQANDKQGSIHVPSEAAFKDAYRSIQGQQLLQDKVTVLHCTTEYPAPFNEINLRAMSTIAKQFSLPVGYSDHSQGISVPIAAIACGAQIIEKHFTLSREMPGPDHKASLEPSELTEMVKAIRQVEQALGRPEKSVQPSEAKNIAVARKSLVAATNIQAGEAFTEDNLTCKRPGNGVGPMNYWRYLGQSATRSYQAGDLIE